MTMDDSGAKPDGIGPTTEAFVFTFDEDNDATAATLNGVSMTDNGSGNFTYGETTVFVTFDGDEPEGTPTYNFDLEINEDGDAIESGTVNDVSLTETSGVWGATVGDKFVTCRAIWGN